MSTISINLIPSTITPFNRMDTFHPAASHQPALDSFGMHAEHRPLEALLGGEMHAKYVSELRAAREHHREMSLRVATELTDSARIVCIDMQGRNITNHPGFESLHSDQKRMFYEAHTGIPHGPLAAADMFRYMFGFSAGDPRFVVWNVRKSLSAPVPVSRISAIILTGSEAMVTEMQDAPSGENAPWMRRVLDFFKESEGHRLPLLGVCFGHQIRAFHAGAKIDWMTDRQGVRFRETGPSRVILRENFRNDPLFGPLGRSFWIHASHSQAIQDRVNGASVIAGNKATSIQAVRYGDTPHWGIQNHPEMTAIYSHVLMSLSGNHANGGSNLLTAEAHPVKRALAHGFFDEILRFERLTSGS